MVKHKSKQFITWYYVVYTSAMVVLICEILHKLFMTLLHKLFTMLVHAIYLHFKKRWYVTCSKVLLFVLLLKV